MHRDFHTRLAGVFLLMLAFGGPRWLRAQDVTELPPTPDAGSGTNGLAQTAAKKSPLVTDPTTPEELFEAAVLMADIARADLSKQYLEKLLAQNPDEETLVALRDKFGGAPFLRLARIDELRQPAEKLLDLSNAALGKRASDPQRIARLIAQLDGTPEEQAVATNEVLSLGRLVVPGLVRVLADAEQAHKHETVMATLVQIGEPAVPQLIGALDGPNVALKGAVITVMGHIRDLQVVPYLWHPALAPDEAAGVREAAREALAQLLAIPPASIERIASQGVVSKLVQSATDHYRNKYNWKGTEDGRVVLWSWNAVEQTIVSRTVPVEIASEMAGLRFATEALGLAPELRAVQTIYLGLAFAGDIRAVGFDQPLPTGPGTSHDLALSVGADVVAQVLTEALEAGRPSTAVAALQVLEQIATLPLLAGGDRKKSSIMAALDYHDARVQFSAASVILQLDPRTQFRGAQRVVEVLNRALSSESRPHAVIGEVSLDRAALLAGILKDLGYEPLIFATGRQAFTAAAERSDVELIVLHPNLIRWPLSETLANLRADSRTAGIPIVIHGPSDLRPRMQLHTQNFRLVAYSPMVQTTSDFDDQIRPFMRKIKTPSLTQEQRAHQRAAAAVWFAHIALGRRMNVFDITSAERSLGDAIEDPTLSVSALEALGEIATRTAQERLAQATLDIALDNETRQTAASKLAFHIQRFGLLLSRDGVAALHQLWEADRTPADLRTAVGGVIGSLKPDATLVGKRLQAHSPRSR